MKKLIYGSVAAKHWFPDFRDTKDLDYICEDTSKRSKEIEYHWTPSFQYVLDNNVDDTYVDPNFLYTIKFSHAAWDIRWTKTMKDIRFFKNKGCVLDLELYNMLLKDWEIIHGKKKVNLNQDNSEFFTKYVKREYDHDWLHGFLAFYDEPLHTKIRKTDKPLCYKDLWDDLSLDDQYKCALEEIYVVATERYDNYPPKIAKFKSMKNIITSMTKGWFNYFLIDNFEELLYNEYDSHWLIKLEELRK